LRSGGVVVLEGGLEIDEEMGSEKGKVLKG
jgi:hypothetical protein